jgi:hypothetical protein
MNLKASCAKVYLCKLVGEINQSNTDANKGVHTAFIQHFLPIAKQLENKTFSDFINDANSRWNNIYFFESTRDNLFRALEESEKLCDEIIAYYRYIYLGIEQPDKQERTLTVTKI